MLEEHPSMSLERLVELKYSTRMELADRVLDELTTKALQSGDAMAKQAAEVLAAWDRQALPTSTGTLLFTFWVQAMQPLDPQTLSDLFRTDWNPVEPLTTPSGLKDPDKAVQALSAAAGQMQTLFGRLDMPWGDIARLQRGSVDLPANGYPGDPFGSFRVLFFDTSTLETSKQVSCFGGDTYVAAVEFSDPLQAQVLMTYGNASQPGSPHIGDQLPLSAKGEMRPAWRTRAEIEANLEAQEQLG
jgi:acyl-homoserine-lactone acylase